jgi:N-succinyldiaminopimelate aminotransferase
MRAGRVQGMPETVFSRYARLALATGAVNLGQGFPDDPPAAPVRAALIAAAEGAQQYAPRIGIYPLRAEIARITSESIGREVDPETEVAVTVGATEALFASLAAFIDPGDEVLLIAPCYDAYPFMVALAGGKPRYVPMEVAADGRWTLDPNRLAAAVGPRTKAILLNDPHNPTGAVLPPEVVEQLGIIARHHDLLLLVDAVYEQVSFVPTAKVAAAAPERTLHIGSAGKTFGVTGWKVGWLVGPAALVAAVTDLRQWVSYAVATPLQRGVATLLAQVDTGGEVDTLLADQRRDLAARRDTLLSALRAAGARPTLPEAGYFIHADVRAWGVSDDRTLCDALPARAGVVAIPGSAFHLQPGAAGPVWVRFAFCRGATTVAEGGRRLQAMHPEAPAGADSEVH